MLDNELLFQESYLCLYYDHVNEWLYADWIGEQNFQTVQSGCEQILKIMKSELCHKILNDNIHVTNLWSEVSDWVAFDWFPRLAATGLTYIAWIYSPNTFSRLSAEKTMKHQVRNIIILPFEEMDSARTWLKSV